MKQVVGGTARMMGTAKTFTYNDPNRKNTVGSTGCTETSHKQQDRTDNYITIVMQSCNRKYIDPFKSKNDSEN
jgi:hypothetical protein